MSGFSAGFYVFIACAFGFVGFIAGAVTFASIRQGGDSDITIVAAVACVGFVLLTFLCIRQAVRNKRRGRVPIIDKPILVGGFRCPCCESASILLMPPNAISPFASYECGDCGIGLIASGTRLAYLFIVIFATALLVFACSFIAESLGICIKLGAAALVVLGYAIPQLTRKSVRKMDDESESNL